MLITLILHAIYICVSLCSLVVRLTAVLKMAGQLQAAENLIQISCKYYLKLIC